MSNTEILTHSGGFSCEDDLKTVGNPALGHVRLEGHEPEPGHIQVLDEPEILFGLGPDVLGVDGDGQLSNVFQKVNVSQPSLYNGTRSNVQVNL